MSVRANDDSAKLLPAILYPAGLLAGSIRTIAILVWRNEVREREREVGVGR